MTDLIAEVVRDRIAADVPPNDLDLVAGLISDRVAEDADLAAINAAISAARVEWGPLFLTAPASAAAAPQTRADKRAASRISTALAAGNPYRPGPTESVTRQAVLESLAPDKAAELRREAGK